MFRLFKVIKEISLYREYVKIIKTEEMNSPIWARRNLRRDYLNRIYTVINLPPQILLSSDLPKESRPSFVVSGFSADVVTPNGPFSIIIFL